MSKLHKKYLSYCSLVFLLGMALVAALNLVVDPFGAYRTVNIDALRGHRAKLGDRIAKAEMLRRGPWDVVILGSSRAQVGIDPSDSLWEGARVINGALTATNLLELAGVMEYAAEVSRPKRVIFMVDFLMFDENRAPQSGFAKSRFNTDRSLAEYHTGSLLGAHATASSWQVLKDWARSKPSRYDESGHALGIGHRSKYTARYRFKRTLENFLEGMYAHYLYSPTRVDCFRRLVRTCLANGTELTVAISPVHALQLEAIRQAGLWLDFERFKRDLVAVVSQEEESFSIPVAVWDFTSFAGPNAEPVPPAEDPADMNWYWESSHYKSELGQLVLKRVIGDPQPVKDWASNFGTQINAANVEQHLSKLRRQREDYVASHPEDMALLRDIKG